MLCLKVPTDSSWAQIAGQNFHDVLRDHAHCELKAASHALSLIGRHELNHEMATKLSELAREELDHFERVLQFLRARGGVLGFPQKDAYAAKLRKASSSIYIGNELLLADRLLVGALIEARSCERFKLLLAHPVIQEDKELHAFYTELFETEAKHFRTYCDLALLACGDAAFVSKRLEELSHLEAEVVRELEHEENRATIHG